MGDRVGMITKASAKNILGELPLTAEAFWYLRQGGKPPRTGFKLNQLEKRLPLLVSHASEAANQAPRGKNLLIFCTLHFWISHGAILGLALSGYGHKVTLAYMPYQNSSNPINKFDLRRQNIYAGKVLEITSPQMETVSFLDRGASPEILPVPLREEVDKVSLRDTQYIMQIEDVPADSPLYDMRTERNWAAASTALKWINSDKPDLIIIPNGSILEFGSVYQVARYLSIPVTTYEFGEQRNRIWLAQDAEVMKQQTNDLWNARGGNSLSTVEMENIRTLLSARQKASMWGNFARRWQGVPNVGGENIRKSLELDERPIVLLATNVIGDSLTLGRQVFSDSMTAWLERTVKYFAERNEAQLVLRIHPGELVTRGPSVGDVVHQVFPEGLPVNIHLIPADAETNTYDLVEIADLGLVYTTTVGLEMAMSGVPVVVIGQTHYRGKGFTLDPESWNEYFDLLTDILSNPREHQPDRSQVDAAWEYAYRFFFEYPHPFPWHLLYLWEDLDTYSLEYVLSEEGKDEFEETFRYLVGEPINW
jgi:hypothetical protein